MLAAPRTGPSAQRLRVVVVEDEEDLRNLLHMTLEDAGFDVVAVEHLLAARAAVAVTRPAVIVLDRMLADGDGIALCNELRRAKDGVAVLVLSALGTERDRVEGFEAGADDYVVKPFSLRELSARVHVLAGLIAERRRGTSSMPPSAVLRWRELALDTTNHHVHLAGVEIELRPLEFKLLATFLEQPRRAFGREELLTLLWGGGARPSSRTIDVHVTRLRQRLGNHGEAIETVPGYGYRLRDE
jgi:two-component system phosphate regulon response regulator PhoB